MKSGCRGVNSCRQSGEWRCQAGCGFNLL